MSGLIDAIDARIAERSLLRHSFYTRWVAGTLPLAALQEYGRQYFRFEAVLPRVLSSIHSQLDDLADRQLILENLVDEERGSDSHVELWFRFAEVLGVARGDVAAAKPLPGTLALVDCYRSLAASSAGDGLAALYAYERQVPAVAAAKLRGLAEHYDIVDGRGTAFWSVHHLADAAHASAEASLLARHGGAASVAAADRALDAWWDFLDGVEAAAG